VLHSCSGCRERLQRGRQLRAKDLFSFAKMRRQDLPYRRRKKCADGFRKSRLSQDRSSHRPAARRKFSVKGQFISENNRRLTLVQNAGAVRRYCSARRANRGQNAAVLVVFSSVVGPGQRRYPTSRERRFLHPSLDRQLSGASGKRVRTRTERPAAAPKRTRPAIVAPCHRSTVVLLE
jgi:hypothetical protein